MLPRSRGTNPPDCARAGEDTAIFRAPVCSFVAQLGVQVQQRYSAVSLFSLVREIEFGSWLFFAYLSFIVRGHEVDREVPCSMSKSGGEAAHCV